MNMKRKKNIKYALGIMVQNLLKMMTKTMRWNQIGATMNNNQLILLYKDQEESFLGFLFFFIQVLYSNRSLDNQTALPNEKEMISIFELQRLESKSISQILSVVRRFSTSISFLSCLRFVKFQNDNLSNYPDHEGFNMKVISFHCVV